MNSYVTRLRVGMRLFYCPVAIYTGRFELDAFRRRGEWPRITNGATDDD